MQNIVHFYAGGLDRASHLRRDPAWLYARLADERSLFVPVWRGQNLVLSIAGSSPRAAFLKRSQLGGWMGESVLLGIEDDVAYFALDLSASETPLATIAAATPVEFTDLRRIGQVLPRREAALLAYARGILYWHSHHRFCGVCGHPTISEEGGHVRRCTNPVCVTTHFPRTDPAVIMLVHDGDRCLLGHKPGWPAGMHSTLAGFVEPGESLEEAVRREVFEETGIRTGEVAYHSSQPWPFPASLMLGFHAHATSTEITVDAQEIDDARWYERGFLREHRDDESFRLPRGDSIARQLVEDWLRW